MAPPTKQHCRGVNPNEKLLRFRLVGSRSVGFIFLGLGVCVFFSYKVVLRIRKWWGVWGWRFFFYFIFFSLR